jgi:uncharacterized protein involved in exopolysaccharide biosynthesis
MDTLARREVLSILFKHGKLLLGLFLGGFALIFGGSFIFSSTYKAEAQVLVQSGREYTVSTEQGNNPAAGVPYITKQEIINSEVEILKSRDIAEAVIQAVGLARIYPGIANNGESHVEQMAEAVKKFGKRFKAEPVAMSNIISLQYWNTDRDVAIEALQKLARIYESRHAFIYGNRRSGVLGQQTGEYEKRLEGVTQQITNLKNSEHLSDISYERQQLIQDRSDVEAKLRDLKVQSIEAHRNRDYYRQLLKSMPELVLTNENSADAVETAKSRLLDLQTKLLQLKQRYADGNADARAQVQDLEGQISAIQSFIADPSLNTQTTMARNAAFDDGRLKLQNAEAAVPAIDEKIDFETAADNKILSRLQALDDGEAGLEVMAREQDTLRELVHNYRDRYEEARSSGDLDKQNVISVSMIHAPAADLKPDKPKRLLWGVAGFVAGLMWAGAAILYLLVYRDSIITTESLERTLGLPVLGAVPGAA